MAVRLLALDLDGTIVNSDLRVTARVRRAVTRAIAAGVHVTLASGRYFQGSRSYAQELGIREPLICLQGAIIQDPNTEHVYHRCGVPLNLAREFIAFTRECGWDLLLYLGDCLYVDRVTPLLRYYAEYTPAHEELHAVGDLQAFLTTEPLKLLVVTEPEQAMQVDGSLREHFEGRLHIVRSFSRFVEGTNLQVSKGQALAFLARTLGVAQSETMAIGDNDNDADMVAWAGLGVAMGNASAAVKAAAEYLAPSIDEDGAAQAIERFVLGGTA